MDHKNDFLRREGRSIANEPSAENVDQQRSLTPPPFQLKSKETSTESDQELSDQDISQFSIGDEVPPPADDKPSFQLKDNSSSGSPIQPDIRDELEAGFQQDFSKVNVHTNSSDAEGLNARAFTSGNDIFFGNGQYNPQSGEGKQLLAHELTHVVQQREGRVQPTTTVAGQPVNDSDSLEKEADDMGNAILQKKSMPGKESKGSHKSDHQMMPSTTVQRWEWPWNWGGGDKTGKDKKGKDDKKTELKKVKQAGSRKGANFNSKVTIPGPSPAMGAMDVELRIKVNFLDCDMKNIKKYSILDKHNHKTFDKQIKAIKKKTPDLLKWDKKSKAKFKKDYQSAVTNVWDTSATKLAFKLDQKDYEKYQVNNNIKLVFTDKNPHETINTIKMLPSMNRLRSYRWTEDLFDSRDVSVKEKRTMPTNYLVEQIGEFDSGSDALNAPVMSKINSFVTKAKAIMKEHAKDTPTPSWNAEFRGRSSSDGSKKTNQKISLNRAINVENEVSKKLTLPSSSVFGTGETNTDTNKKYRRVEAIFQDGNTKTVSQNVAAHETGHMFGLGDEYEDENTASTLPKSTGDEANDTSQAIRDAGMGEAIVEEHRINQHNDSIMNAGSNVSMGHYSFFLLELKKIATDAKTGAEVNWQVLNV